MAIRLSTLAEVKILSLASYLYASKPARDVTGSVTLSEIEDKLDELRETLRLGHAGLQGKSRMDSTSPFTTVGLARQVRIDEDFGTQNVYGIGSPTRPRIVPNNYSVSVTVDRLQLDTRNLAHYMTMPNYWYSDDVQRKIGIDDFLLYTYLFVRSKEDTSANAHDIYALLPRSASTTQSSGDVMVVHNVSLTGFKYSYEEFYFDASNLTAESLTGTVA